MAGRRTHRLVSLILGCFISAGSPALAKDDPMGAAYMAGYEKLQKKEYAEARERFEEALRLAEQTWQQGACHYRVAECLQAEGKLTEAVDHYARAVRSKRDDGWSDDLGRQRYVQDALARLADVAPKAGRPEVVGESVTWFLAAFPAVRTQDRVTAYGQAARALAAASRVNEATAYLEARLAEDKYLDPGAAVGLRMVAAECLERAGQHEAALAQLAKAGDVEGAPLAVAEATVQRGELLIDRLGRPAEGRRLLEAALDQVPTKRQAGLRMTIAESYVKEGRLDEAVEAYKALLADPQVGSGDRRRAVEYLAKLLASKDQYAKAEALLLESSRAEAIDAGEQQHYLRVLYDLAMRAGNLETALETTESILGLEHQRPETVAGWRRDALRRQADVLWRQGKRDEALVALGKGLEIEPADRNQVNDLRLRLGNWLSEHGQHDAAREHLGKVKLDADAHPHHRVRACVYLSDSHRRERQPAKGRGEIEWALANLNTDDNQRADLVWRQAEAFREEKRDEDCLAACERVLGLEGVNPDYHRRAAERAGDVLGRLERFDEASAILNRTMEQAELNGKQLSTLLHMRFRVERDGGKQQQARATAAELIKLDADHRHVKEVKGWLEKQE